MTKSISKKIIQDTVKINVKNALNEDHVFDDNATELLNNKIVGDAFIRSNQKCILCGIPWANECFKQINVKIKIEWLVEEGISIKKNQKICFINGPYKDLLAAERTVLNFLQTLSGTATSTFTYVHLLKKYHANLYDTRKTIPGLRIAQKYAVRIGGGFNQRLNLSDKILVKENHIQILGSVDLFLTELKKDRSLKDIQIEVENLNEFKVALKHGAKNILLDNFSIQNVKKAVVLNKKIATLEASGDINKKTIVSYAKTGVDRISVGSITKNLEAIDFSMIIKQIKDV